MGRNTRKNRIRKEIFARHLSMVEDRISIGDFDEASRLLEALKLQGCSGSHLFELSKRLAEASKLCSCWYCGFTPEQKKRVAVDAEKKAAVLGGTYANHDNNWIGGYAEAVFGARFNLPLDFEPGPDGGIDFSIFCSHTPSGILTIDVKGTKYIEFRLAGIERSWEDARGWGYDENFIRRRDHIYVLIVTRSEHAFFKGFAFGTDEFAIRFPRFPGARPGYSPKRLRLMSSWF